MSWFSRDNLSARRALKMSIKILKWITDLCQLAHRAEADKVFLCAVWYWLKNNSHVSLRWNNPISDQSTSEPWSHVISFTKLSHCQHVQIRAQMQNPPEVQRHKSAGKLSRVQWTGWRHRKTCRRWWEQSGNKTQLIRWQHVKGKAKTRHKKQMIIKIKQEVMWREMWRWIN